MNAENFLKLFLIALLGVFLAFSASAEDSDNEISYVEISVDKLNQTVSDFQQGLTYSSNFLVELSSTYGLNRYNLSLAGLMVILLIVVFTVLPSKGEMEDVNELDDLELQEDNVPEVKVYEDIETRVGQLQTEIKKQEEPEEELLEKLGEANRLRDQNKFEEAEELLKEVEDAFEGD